MPQLSNFMQDKPMHYSFQIPVTSKTNPSFEWEIPSTNSFERLIVGWNATRPTHTEDHISVSLKLDRWAPWMPYAVWSPKNQYSFQHISPAIDVYQDTISVKNGAKATGWKVKVEGKDLQRYQSLYASYPLYKEFDEPLSSCIVNISGLSQMQIPHPHHNRLCSPTSTTAVIRFLNKQSQIEPLTFAKKVWDSQFDIYGHWIFAAAQAFVELEEQWEVKAIHLSSFKDIHTSLCQNVPVVISIKGPLQGAPLPYESGHLLVVYGYDAAKNLVLCMDPAFPSDKQTHTAYALSSLNHAWRLRENIAYVFNRRHS